MGIGDFADKAKDAANSEQGEQFTDQGLDQASEGLNNATGGKFEDQLNQGRDAADGAIGNE